MIQHSVVSLDPKSDCRCKLGSGRACHPRLSDQFDPVGSTDVEFGRITVRASTAVCAELRPANGSIGCMMQWPLGIAALIPLAVLALRGPHKKVRGFR
eukprot:6000884-Amphidinium_carterae.1